MPAEDRVAYGFLTAGTAAIIAGAVTGGPWLPVGILLWGCFLCTPTRWRR